MTPGELSRIEDALRRAYGDVLESVRRHGSSPTLIPDFRPGRPGRRLGRPADRHRWLLPVAAAAAVAVIALVAGLIVPGALRPAATPLVPAHMAYVVTTGAVIPVDLATGAALAPIRFPAQGGTTAAAMAAGGRTIYVTTYEGYLIPISTRAGKAGRPIRIGPAGQIVVSPDGRTAYALEQSRVAVINLTTHTVTRFINMPSALSFAITPDGRTLYVLQTLQCPQRGHTDICTGETVTPIDTATLKLLPPVQTSATEDGRYIAVAPDGKTAYVAGEVAHGGLAANETGVLTPISTATNTALTPVQLGPGNSLAGPISFSPDGRIAYLGGYPVTAVNLDTGTVSWTARSPVSGYAPLVSPDGRTVYAVGLAVSEHHPWTPVYRIRAATGTLQGPVIPEVPGSGFFTLAPFNGDTWVDLSPDGTTLYAIRNARLEAVDAATGRVEWVLRLPVSSDFLLMMTR